MDKWIVNQWAKKAILLSFRLNDNEIIKASHMQHGLIKYQVKLTNWNKLMIILKQVFVMFQMP